MAKEVIIKITADTSVAARNISELGDAVATMKKQLETTDIGSAEFQRLTDEIGRTEQAMKDLGKTTEQVMKESADAAKKAANEQEKAAKETKSFSDKAMAAGESIEKVGQGIAGAFGLATGVVGAFGEQLGFSSEEVAAAQEKAESFILILTSLKPVIEGAKAGMAEFNAVAAANPIGIIVAGVGLLIAAFIAFRKPIIEFLSNWENLKLVLLAMLGPIGWIIIAYQKLFAAEDEVESERDKNSRKNTDRYKKEVQEINDKRALDKMAFENRQEEFDRNIARLDAEGKNSYELKVQKLQDIIDEQKAVIDHNKALVKAAEDRYIREAELRGQSREDFMKSIGLNEEQLRAQLDEEYAEQEKLVFDAETKLIELKTAKREENMAAATEAAEKELAYLYALTDLRIANIENETDRALAAMYERHEREIKEVQDQYGKETELEKELIRKQEQELKDFRESLNEDIEVNDVGVAEEYDFELEAEAEYLDSRQQLLKDWYDQGKITADEYYANLGKSEGDLQDYIQAKRLETAQKGAEIASQYSNAVNSLAEGVFALSNRFGDQDEKAKEKRAKRQFQINKALALSSAVIDGFKAITASLAAAPLVIGVLPNPVGIANLVVTAAATAANIAKIASSKYESSGGGSAATTPTASSAASSSMGGDIGSSSPTTPSFNLFGRGNNMNNTGPGQNNNQQSGPTLIKAYVSETDLINTQDRLQLIKSEL